jgi:hypothetical protein
MFFKKGTRVQHPQKPEWGMGKVLEDSVNDKVQVYFAEFGKVQLSLKHVSLITVTGNAANHPKLDNLKTTTSKKGREYKSLQVLKDKFLIQYPGGFSGAEYNEIERNYKWEAHERMHEQLNQSEFQRQLEEMDYPEICKRALQICNATNLIFPNEKMDLKDGLVFIEQQKYFSETLYDLLYGIAHPEVRFTQFADCLLEIGAAKWTIATYYLFITDPEKNMFLKPKVTQQAADVCAFELNYRPALNWLTYKNLLEFSNYLMKNLSELKPKDMIDVQSFIWCIAQD